MGNLCTQPKANAVDLLGQIAKDAEASNVIEKGEKCWRCLSPIEGYVWVTVLTLVCNRPPKPQNPHPL